MLYFYSPVSFKEVFWWFTGLLSIILEMQINFFVTLLRLSYEINFDHVLTIGNLHYQLVKCLFNAITDIQTNEAAGGNIKSLRLFYWSLFSLSLSNIKYLCPNIYNFLERVNYSETGM